VAHPLRFFTEGARKIVSLFGFPDYALHINSGILVPDSRGHPELEGPVQAKLQRQRQRDRLLHGPLTFLARLHAMALLVLGLAGMFLAVRRRHPFLRLCLWLIVGWTVAHVFFWAQPRFRAPLDILFALLAAAAITWIVTRLRRLRSPTRLVGQPPSG